jgi:catechol 2,3-dioxygenase-like lactoylglutathione lyase family enzyme
MARGLDHIAHAVRDLDAAADLYRRLGFTVGARNVHSWGTENHLVQFSGFFIELLTVTRPDKLTDEGLPRLFGQFTKRFLESNQGLHLLFLESSDAAKDAGLFAEAGIADSEALRFEREGKRPDGSPVKVGFSLAFARDPQAAQTSFAVCQQHFPENFWNPAFQDHANGVKAVAGAVLVAENPTDHHIFLSAFAGERELQSTSSGISVATPRGEIQIMDPSAFRSHFDFAPPDISHGARLAAIRFVVRDLSRAGASISGVTPRKHMGRLVIGPDVAMGATLAFEEAAPRHDRLAGSAGVDR